MTSRNSVVSDGLPLKLKGWEHAGHLQGSLGPSGPETPKKSEKSLPEPPAPGPPESLEKVSKKSFGTFSSLFPDSPDFFETFSPDFFGGEKILEFFNAVLAQGQA